MKDWIHFFCALPFFLAGLAWAWMRDHFGRGRRYYVNIIRE